MKQAHLYHPREIDTDFEPPSFDLRQSYLIRNLDTLDKTEKKQIRKGLVPEKHIALIEEISEEQIRYFLEELRFGIKKKIIQITKEEFELIWPETEGFRLRKIESSTSLNVEGLGEIPANISEYQGELEGLNVVDVEFPSIQHTFRFNPENLEEITGKKEYQEDELVLTGIPRHFFTKEQKYAENVPRYELNHGKHELWLRICNMKLKSHKDKLLVVAIAGGSNSGKTQIVASDVDKKSYRNSMILSLDNYYHGAKWMEEQRKLGNYYNWDQPEALNLELLREHIEKLKRGEKIEVPVYDFKTHEPDPEKKIIIDPAEYKQTENLSEKQLELRPKHLEVLVIEGLFALNDILKSESDLKVFIASDSHTRLLRRLFRDVVERGRNPEDILKTFAEIVDPMHRQYIEPSSENADMIINNPLIPKLESHNSGLHEVQLKFSVKDLRQEDLLAKGAKHLETFEQIDNYYDPKDRNLMETQEMMRIRTETANSTSTSKKFFTYKGPKIRLQGYLTRPIFECEIDPGTQTSFSEQYGDENKTIIKERALYELDGIIFSLDKVKKIVCGKEVNLGTFIEIRSIEPVKDKKINGNSALNGNVVSCEKSALKHLAEKLGIPDTEAIKESYFEM
jgi:uridine kinase